MTSRKILCVTTSPLPYGNNITDGPGYRAWNLFQEFSKKHEVVFISLNESFHRSQRQEKEAVDNGIHIRCVSYKPSRIARVVKEEAPDTLYLPWSSLSFISGIKQKIPTIIDYVGTGLLEDYAMLGCIPAYLLDLKLRSFWQGDFLMTAGRRERYYLLGLLIASRRLCFKSETAQAPAIHFVPMTPPTEPPKFTKKVIDKNEEIVILVAGALLPWYDYSTLLKALRLLVQRGHIQFKIVFMGGKPRNIRFDSTFSGIDSRVKSLLSKGLEDKVEFTGYVPFKERANYYLTADIGINIGSSTLENEIATRTRIVDYLWGNLPLVTSGGDEYSELVVEAGAGFQYVANNPTNLADLLERLMKNQTLLQDAKRNIGNLLQKDFNIKRTISPLSEFLDAPYVEPLRKSPKRFAPTLFLQFRDLLNLALHAYRK